MQLARPGVLARATVAAIGAATAFACLGAAQAYASPTLLQLSESYQISVENYQGVLGQQGANAKEIAHAQEEVQQAQAELERTQEVSAEAAVALYKTLDNRNDALSMILGSSSLTEAIQRHDAYERVEAYYRETMEQTRQKKADLEQKVAQLEERKAQIADELSQAEQAMDEAEAALRDADHSDGADYHQLQGNGSNCGATSFIVGVNTLLHENRYLNNVAVWNGAGFNGDSTVNVGGKARVWLQSQGLDRVIAVNDVLGDIHTTDQLRAELEQGNVVIISSGPGSMWQRANGRPAPLGTFPDGHFMLVYYYADGVFYANDSSVPAEQGAGVPYTEDQMQQWLDGRPSHFATVLSKIDGEEY